VANLELASHCLAGILRSAEENFSSTRLPDAAFRRIRAGTIVALSLGVMKRILVLYGTTEGHTEMIATAIGNALIALGFDVHVIQAGSLDPQPSIYDGIIVAASVHGGRYQTVVGRWLEKHAAELRVKPTAFVSASLGAVQHDPKVDAELDAVVHRFLDPIGWQPTVIKPVAGALLYTKYNVLMRWMMKRIARKAGGYTDTSRDYDFTDWDDLQVFAEDFGRRIAAAGA
jgi:menaquinone-dependent protoporphyrinogen oxidase